jgi:hypothetical protein
LSYAYLLDDPTNNATHYLVWTGDDWNPMCQDPRICPNRHAHLTYTPIRPLCQGCALGVIPNPIEMKGTP